MQMIKKALAVVVLASFAGTAFAQVGSLSDGTLSMGQQVPPQNAQQPTAAPGDDVTSEIIGAWDLQCAKTGPEPRPCRMYQLLKDQAGSPVAEVTMFRLPEGSTAAMGATFVVPLQTLLTAQLTLAFDNGSVKRYPYAYCTNYACFSRVGLTAEEVESFKAGSVVNMQIVPAQQPNQVVSVAMSLNGFTAALEKSVPVRQ